MNLHEITTTAQETYNQAYGAMVMIHSNILTGNYPLAHQLGNVEQDGPTAPNPIVQRISESVKWFFSDQIAVPSLIAGVLLGGTTAVIAESILVSGAHKTYRERESEFKSRDHENAAQTDRRNEIIIGRLLSGVLGLIVGIGTTAGVRSLFASH